MSPVLRLGQNAVLSGVERAWTDSCSRGLVASPITGLKSGARCLGRFAQENLSSKSRM